MGTQKTLDKDTSVETEPTRKYRQQDDVPSWSELRRRVDTKSMAKNSIATATVALLSGFTLPLPMTIIMTSVVIGYLGIDKKATALGGAGAMSISTMFLSGMSGFFAFLFVVPLLLPVLGGLTLGAIGGYTGNQLRQLK